ncbi:MAG: tRNA dihydrouridine synthase DusB [Planctomycetota bacterium]
MGNLKLKSNLVLAPLAGYTSLAFRLEIRALGGVGLATTDLVNARSFLERNRKAKTLIESRPEDRPLAVQIYGRVAEELRDAAAGLEAFGVDVIDINFGCPMPKITRRGAGAALLSEPDVAVRIAAAVAGAVRIPVTCKMRLGPDAKTLAAPDLSARLEDAGVAGIIIHGRTRAQGFTRAVDLAGIRAVVAAVKRIPVFGNGDVTTPEAAKFMMEATGCAGVAIGRGAILDPFLFRRTRHYLDTGEILPEATFEDRIAFMTRHLRWMIEILGERVGCRNFRKIALYYARRFGPAADFERRISTFHDKAEFDAALAHYRVWRQRFSDSAGNLLPKFAPVPPRPSFMAPPGIPVPAIPESGA